jgi:hypothetical protein
MPSDYPIVKWAMGVATVVILVWLFGADNVWTFLTEDVWGTAVGYLGGAQAGG